MKTLDVNFKPDNSADVICHFSSRLQDFWRDLQAFLPLQYGMLEGVRDLARQHNFSFITDNNRSQCTVYVTPDGIGGVLTMSTLGSFTARLSVEVARSLLPAHDLRGADLRGQHLFRRDLRFADLRGADLRGADLESADLRYADLSGADLRGARVRFVYWDGACFDNAKLDAPVSEVGSTSEMWFDAPSGRNISLYRQKTGELVEVLNAI